MSRGLNAANHSPYVALVAGACALIMLGPVAAYAELPATGSPRIEEIIVTGTQSQGAPAVGRNALLAEEQARSIQLYDVELIERMRPEGLEDIVNLSANVAFDGATDGRESRFIVRGFGGAPVLRDGFRVTSFGSVSDPEVFNLEMIEVLKGPDSITYGEANPGGLINLRTKRPRADDHTHLQMEVGSDASVSPRFDINRSVGTSALRLVGLYRYDETFRDYDNANRTYSMLPTYRWDNADGTVITLLGEAVVEDLHADFGGFQVSCRLEG